MNFIQRALKNVTRKMSKSVLLLLTFFVIGNFVIVGLGVSQASENAKIATRKKMRAVVTYQIDYDAVYEYANSITDEDELNEFNRNGYPQIKASDVAELIKDERVKTANANSVDTVYAADGLDFVHLNNSAEENMGSGGVMIDGDGTSYEYRQPTIMVKGNAFPDMIELAEGSFQIKEGRFYNQSEIDSNAKVALITEALANQNNLRVGDHITVYTDDPSAVNPGGYYADSGITLEDMTVVYEVIGIYTHNLTITPDAPNYDWLSPMENPDNMILVPYGSLLDARLTIGQKTYDYYATQNPDDEYYKDPSNRPTADNFSFLSNVTLLLNDPLDVDDFVAEYSSTLPQFIKIDANNDEFNRLAKPLNTLGLFADFIVWLVVINAVVIITLVTALTLKTREYEIGVLLSIGASKLKIIAQFFVELAIVAVIGFTLAVGSGSLIAGKIGTVVLDYQITMSEVDENNNNYFDNGYYNPWDTDYSTDITLDDLVSEYSVSVSPLIILEIYVLGLAIVLVSILVPSMMIMRFNPKKILMNQN